MASWPIPGDAEADGVALSADFHYLASPAGRSGTLWALSAMVAVAVSLTLALCRPLGEAVR